MNSNYLMSEQAESILRNNVIPSALKGDKDSILKLRKSIGKIMVGDLREKERKQVQFYSTSSGFPQLESMPVQDMQDWFDVGYAPLFVDAMPLDLGNGKTISKFSIPTGTTSLVFKKTPEGGEVEIQKVSGDSLDVKYFKSVLNVGIFDELLKFPDRWDIARWELFNVRNAHYNFLADTYYNLINVAAQTEVTAGATGYTAYDTGGSSVLEKDINTINTAVIALANKNLTKPYGNVAVMPLYLLCNINLRSRIMAAIRYSYSGLAGQTTAMVNSPIMPVFSFNTNLTTNNNYARLVIPGRTIQKSVLAEMEAEMDREIITKANITSYTTWMGAGIGDTQQIHEVRFA